MGCHNGDVIFKDLFHLYTFEIVMKCFLLTGESVDDCGGGYSESIAEMCDELMNGSLPLLIPTPNGRDEAGTSRDCFLLNPQSSSAHHMNMFTFLGNLRTCVL